MGLALQSAEFQRLLRPPADCGSLAQRGAWNLAITAALDALPTMGWPCHRKDHNPDDNNHDQGVRPMLRIDCTRWYIEAPSWAHAGLRVGRFPLPVADGPLYAWLAASELGVASPATTARLFGALTAQMGCGTVQILNRVDAVNATPLMHAVLGWTYERSMAIDVLLSHANVNISLAVEDAVSDHKGPPKCKQNALDIALAFDRAWHPILRAMPDATIKSILGYHDTNLHFCMDACPAAFPTLWRRWLALADKDAFIDVLLRESESWTFAALAAADANLWTTFIAALDHPVHGEGVWNDLTRESWRFVIFDTPSDAADAATKFYIRSKWHTRDPLRSAIAAGHELIAIYLVQQCLPDWAIDGYDVDGQTILMRAAAARPPLPRLVKTLLMRTPALDPTVRSIMLPTDRAAGLTSEDLVVADCAFGPAAYALVPTGAEYDSTRGILFAAQYEYLNAYVPAASRILCAMFHLGLGDPCAPHTTTCQVAIPAAEPGQHLLRTRGIKRRRAEDDEHANNQSQSSTVSSSYGISARSSLFPLAPPPLPLDIARLVFAYTGLCPPSA